MRILLLLLLSTALYAQGPRGHWSGAVEIPGHPLPIEVDIDLDANAWIGSMSAGDQTAQLENIAFLNGRWTFRMKGSSPAPTYAGTISPDGHIMAGEFTQGSKTYPFRVLRAGDARVETPKSSPAVDQNLVGRWDGALLIGGRPLRLALQLANDAAGAKAMLISVDQSGSEIPVAAVIQTGTKLELQITMIGCVYKGEINKDGSVLTGAWIQAGQSLPLSFKKSAKPGY